MIVSWTDRARRNLIDQLEYIAHDNFAAAQRLAAEVKRQTELLAKSPEIGRVGRVSRSRELVITRTPFVAIYRIRKNRVEIFRLLHGAQKWPRNEPST